MNHSSVYQNCWSEMKEAVSNHQLVLDSMKSISVKHHLSLFLYTMADVWSKVQAGIQVLISQYVDLSESGLKGSTPSVPITSPSPDPASTAPSDLSSFFTKKAKSRPKNQDLFKFEASFHAITLNSYLLEQLGQQPSVDESQVMK